MENRYKIFVLDQHSEKEEPFWKSLEQSFDFCWFDTSFELVEELKKAIGNHSHPKAVILHSEINHPNGAILVKQIKSLIKLPILIKLERIKPSDRIGAIHLGFSDLFDKRSSAYDLQRRLVYLIENPRYIPIAKENELKPYKMPWAKRLFDIVFSASALICLIPIFLIVALAIRLESKGKVFYYSLRVGTGYQVFRFYKFRSMYTGADSKLRELKHLNQYAGAAEAHTPEAGKTISYNSDMMKQENLLFTDDKAFTEEEYREYRRAKDGAAFIKIKDDPRVTKVGKFIRNTSIDELPQLWNVLKGDMSIVGNRPLPLYEAEKITTDRFALRFIAPAGITGLWQVMKRGHKGEMSEEERMELDNDYARDYSFGRDIKLILQTIPALFQQENV